jgi:hypothetical protein
VLVSPSPIFFSGSVLNEEEEEEEEEENRKIQRGTNQ